MSKARAPARRASARPKAKAAATPKPARAKTKTTPKRAAPRRAPTREGEAKRDATRRTLLECALVLFQDRGVEATTMRDIARAAGLSLGAAYYYFPSKEALVFAYYEDNQAQMEELARAATGTIRERLGALFHGKLESIRPHRAMLASILAHLINPGDPLSAFHDRSHDVRARAIGVVEHTLAGAVPAAALPIVALALWLAQMGSMLLYVNDDSPDAARTHRLVDEGLDLLVPLLAFTATPLGLAMCEQVTGALARAALTGR